MRTVTRFKRSIHAEVVSGDGVYLVSERPGQTRLHGPLIERLAPLLAGSHTRAEIVTALAAAYPADRVERALEKLQEAGHVIEADVQEDPHTAGFWDLAGLDGDNAQQQLRGKTVEVVGLGEIRTDLFTDSVRGLGIRVVPGDADVRVVLADDYLHPELARINEESLAGKRPWLLVKPTGSVLWIGPLFTPGDSGCWRCMSQRLSGNRMVLSYLRQHNRLDRHPVTSLTALPATEAVAAHLAALQTAKWLTGFFGLPIPQGPATVPSADHREVFTLDTLTMETQRHRLAHRPQCADCGDPGIVAERQLRPVALESRRKRVTSDGGHRAKDPDEFVATHEHLVSPVTGPVTGLIKMSSGSDELHSYTAGQNFAVNMSSVADLRAGLRSMSAGKGMSDAQAKASALAEAIERYSGLHQGDEARIVASYKDLGPKAIAPNDLHLYSDRQFAERDEWNKRDSHFHRVADPFDTDAQVEWTPVWSLTHGEHRYLPTGTLFYGYPFRPGHVFSSADSNGNAAGTCLEDAALQGFMELVERDAVAIWWYNRLRFPGVDLDSFNEPYFTRWQERYRDLHRETWVLDVTSDLGIPTAVAVSRRVDKPVEDILISFGSHFDMKIAVSRALTEMNQFLPAVVPMKADGSGAYAFPDPDQQRWWRTATTENQPYLNPAAGVQRSAADYHDPSSTDLREDLLLAQRTVEAHGMEMHILDQTRPDIGLPVVKVLVPGMRHFWPRYAAGRLYDVPVRTGMLAAPTPESDLNPIGMFL
ncbi:TOMM precursor leader peptide-binding protein [Streptomyces roseoverticillatus]|uniref:TOMM precursor leader peptide-binding protein n=1 Tax=Streptomyces roseoverticillatus TaxID=66429 RepID=UPI0033EC1F7F